MSKFALINYKRKYIIVCYMVRCIPTVYLKTRISNFHINPGRNYVENMGDRLSRLK